MYIVIDIVVYLLLNLTQCVLRVTVSVCVFQERLELFVFHLPSHYRDIDLLHLFNVYGNVTKFSVVRDENGLSRGYGEFDVCIYEHHVIRRRYNVVLSNKIL